MPRIDAHERSEPRLAADRMLPRLANEAIDRIDPADPIDPIDSTDPTDPIDNTDPTELIDSTDPRDPMDNTDDLLVDDTAPVPIHPTIGVTAHDRWCCDGPGKALLSERSFPGPGATATSG